MLRWAIAVCAAISLTPGAMAAECRDGRDDLFDLLGWSVKVLGTGPITEGFVTLGLVYRGEKPFEMIDATVTAVDALGASMGTSEMTRDMLVTPGQTMSTSVTLGNGRRLSSLDPDKVSFTICVKALLYKDGTQDHF